MAAGKYNIAIDQGTDLDVPLTWANKATKVPYNLTGYQARLQIRETAESTKSLADLSTENGLIVLAPTEGGITLRFTRAVTKALISGVYDLKLTSPGGKVMTLIGGKVTVTPAVTRLP